MKEQRLVSAKAKWGGKAKNPNLKVREIGWLNGGEDQSNFLLLLAGGLSFIIIFMALAESPTLVLTSADIQ